MEKWFLFLSGERGAWVGWGVAVYLGQQCTYELGCDMSMGQGEALLSSAIRMTIRTRQWARWRGRPREEEHSIHIIMHCLEYTHSA
jgi:hypothetical protein